MAVYPTLKFVLSGSLILTLRISSYLGIAPVRFAKLRNGWIIYMSPIMCWYSYALISIIDITTICAMVSDYQSPLELSVRMNTAMKSGIWIADAFILMLSATVAVCSSPTKMQRFIEYYGKIQKINEDLKIYTLRRDPEKMRYFFVITYLMSAIVIIAVDFTNIYVKSLNGKKDLTVTNLYGFYYICYIILQLTQIQFVIIVWHAYNTFERISKGLENLLLEKENHQIHSVSNTKQNKDFLRKKNMIPLKAVNNYIDTIAFNSRKYSGYMQNTPVQATSETIHHLALCYSRMSDIVKDIDDSFGITLLLIIGSFLLHLVITPYYLIITFFEIDDESLMADSYKSLFLQSVWCLFHSITLIVIVEPCHRTTKEVQTIKELLGKLLLCSRYDYDFAELKLFYKQLFLNDVHYAPLKVCTLNRALVAAIMSSITTYLVVLIQL